MVFALGEGGGKWGDWWGRAVEGYNTSLGDFFSAQKQFVSLKEAPKLTLGSLPASDMISTCQRSAVPSKLPH